jgi:hypothetical protein
MDQQTLPRPHGALIQPPPAAEAFYSEVLQLMARSDIPFLLSGTFALASYTGIDRPTKDVDVFAIPRTIASPSNMRAATSSTSPSRTSNCCRATAAKARA